MYKIPGDTGHPWRLNKFLDYCATNDADMNFPLLIEYADQHKLCVNDRFWLSFLYSTCYCVATTCFMFEQLSIEHLTQEKLDLFWIEYKPKLIFQTDKKYVKNMNWFVPLVMNFLALTNTRPATYFKKYFGLPPSEVYNGMYKEFLKWQYFGRFTTFLLIEAIAKLTPLKADANWFDWKNGNTATSGMLHILYLDDEAVEFDAMSTLSPSTKRKLEESLPKLKKAIKRVHPDMSTNIVDIETALCGFRKLFKASRYGGYYIDRVQAELNIMSLALPEADMLWNELWRYRIVRFDHAMLGELQGWNGIQKHRNVEWLQRGCVGNEIIS